jgi:2-C-methyl-D-erythritol 4-phosphate cytidylyltransferase
MQATLPKQFIKIGHLPVLMHTINRFLAFSPSIQIILVLPEKEIILWQSLCKIHQFTIPVTVIKGGHTRFDSVKNGLAAIENPEGLVAIHDGVRPFVSIDTIRQSFDIAQSKGCAIAAVALKDSIRRVDTAGNNQAEDRSLFRLVQTPQTFQVALIKDSFQKAGNNNQFTDDASVAEKAGYSIHLVEGSYENIKITTPEDLIWAEAFLMKNN